MTRLILTLIVGLWSASVQAIELKSVRSSADQDSSRVVLELSGRPQFSSFNLSNPSRLVLDVSNLSTSSLSAITTIDDSRITRIRSSVRGQGSRLVFDLGGD